MYRCSQPEKESQDEQKSAKKRQPVVKPAVQETMSATVPLGYEEMLTELEAIVADAEARLAEEEAAA
ncbi:hypothetical protein COG87_15685 [Salmonella enterica]|uniref:Uncharacterized protein n=2 Tax=Salmonella paratyphi B TaxID=57045 RepID=A0A8E6NJ97_SALEB|nr:hypothetical protein [Salmonella enterica]ECE7001951.1 hypothetical protein [Salmonella enterica subsp. enterica]QVQ06409.1 hypothetical protein CAH13_03210 [Salmonella enterica subsp. enterica serovar Paratyphi B str. CFSAN000541]HAE2679897.1 hypothetical protein [Salmonella enterica subsp. enterica serovar Paratyphi B]EBG4094767.1 hypothetical protein [Salmonella enterica]EBT8110774.1 hypothetical protein [Salmonella enterica]